MRRRLMLCLLLAASGCGRPASQPITQDVDIGNAAEQAQGAIDTYAANALESASRPVPAPVAASTADTAEPGAEAAAEVVRRYFAAIAAERYADAFALWDGDASGLTEQGFADSFARFGSYHATVGAPGEIDAGAGQRYVTVPVTVQAVLKQSGAPYAAAGAVTLHRSGNIDGATAEQRSWRIRTVELR